MKSIVTRTSPDHTAIIPETSWCNYLHEHGKKNSASPVKKVINLAKDPSLCYKIPSVLL
jgi:hypothetical protein